MTFRSKLRRLPQVITLMRKEARYRSQSAAAQAVQAKTGVKLSKAQISQWERGQTMPNLMSLLAFLEGLGYTLSRDLDAEGSRVRARPRNLVAVIFRGHRRRGNSSR